MQNILNLIFRKYDDNSRILFLTMFCESGLQCFWPLFPQTSSCASHGLVFLWNCGQSRFFFDLMTLSITDKRFTHGKSSKCEVVRTSTTASWVTFLTGRLLKDRKHLVSAGKPCLCHQDSQEVLAQPYLQTYRIYCRVCRGRGWRTVNMICPELLYM